MRQFRVTRETHLEHIDHKKAGYYEQSEVYVDRTSTGIGDETGVAAHGSNGVVDATNV
jgi:hypothetical protein